MKKLIAVFLAALMILSFATIAFTAFAEEASLTTTAAAEDANDEQGNTIDLSGYPEWFQNVVTRLIEVFTKLLVKLGFKIAIGSILL